MPVTDEDCALQAIAALEQLSEEQKAAQASINRILHDGEPFVDVHELFGYYNILYFRKLLVPRVEVLWSPKLTLCAGICELTKDPSTGKYTRIRLKLSTPLLQYRPRSDTINTLLHEAIHAYFFVTTSWRHSRGDDGTGHGVGFQLLADAINNHGAYEVTIYHTFHDEVDSYRTHVWQCDGPCRDKPPYFGLVKRSMNRPPGKYDSWWSRHEAECGGKYTKIQEPEPSKKQLEALSKKERAGRQKNKIDTWVKTAEPKSVPDESVENSAAAQSGVKDGSSCKGGKTSLKTVLPKKPSATIVVGDVLERGSSGADPVTGKKRARAEDNDEEVLFVEKKLLVECPICDARIAESDINEHLDVVHP